MRRTTTRIAPSLYDPVAALFRPPTARWRLSHRRAGYTHHYGMAQGFAGSLPCYTFGSMYHENQDVYLARRVAEICGQPHQVITADGGCLAKFPHYAERTLYLTDGCVDVSRTPDLYSNEMARQIAPVRMVGTFGSEIICGAVMFKAVTPSHGIYRQEVLAQISKARDTYRSQIGGNGPALSHFARQPHIILVSRC